MCPALLDLLKYGIYTIYTICMPYIHVYIWGCFFLLFAFYKNEIIFYILFYILFSFTLKNPSKKSDISLILFKHVLYIFSMPPVMVI